MIGIDQPQSPSTGALQHFATLLTPKPTAQGPWCMSRGVSYLDDAAMVPVYEWSSVPERFHKG
jgi:hypothetical protein